jgi:putative hydrolase
MHVHSTFSDGANTIAENVAEAERLGLEELTCVDHVRQDSDWVADYVAAVDALRSRTRVRLHCAVEAKLLDTSGALDLPPELDGVDAIYAADHQVPLADGPHNPTEVRALIEAGELRARDVIEALVTATANALGGPRRMVIAHLFSVLPKLGLSEHDVEQEQLESLAGAAAASGASIEIDERWRCPGARSLRPFVRRGVPVLLSTDSHRRETIARYEYCTGVLHALADGG